VCCSVSQCVAVCCKLLMTLNQVDENYVQVNMSVRGAARYILGAVDWGFLGKAHPHPQLADVERILIDLRTARVASKKRGVDGHILKEGDKAGKASIQTPNKKGDGQAEKKGNAIIPALIEKAKGRVDESAFYIAVEFLYKFWCVHLSVFIRARRMYAHTCQCVRVCLADVHAHAQMRGCAGVHKRTCTWLYSERKNLRYHIKICVYICMYIHLSQCLSMCACVFARVCVTQ